MLHLSPKDPPGMPDPVQPPPESPRGPAPADHGQAELLDVVERQLAQCRRFAQPLTVLSVGVDRVCALDGKPTEGLEPAVAHELWNRLRARTRAKDSVIRLAGLDFGVLLPGCRPADASGARQRLAVALGGVYALGNDPVVATVSIGLASYTPGLDTAAQLWAAASAARTGGGLPAGIVLQGRR